MICQHVLHSSAATSCAATARCAWRVCRRFQRWWAMRQADGQQPADGLQTFSSTRPCRRTLTVIRAVDGDLTKVLRHMLPCWRWTTRYNRLLRPVVEPIDKQLQSGLLPRLSHSLELLADCQRSSEHRGWYNLPSTNEGSPSRYRTSHEPRGPLSIRLAPSTVMAPVCRSYRKRTVDLAASWDPIYYVLLFPYGIQGTWWSVQVHRAMRQADGLQTFSSTRPCRRTLTVIRAVHGDLTKELRHMLPCWRWTTDSYVRSLNPYMSSCSQVYCRSLSLSLELLAGQKQEVAIPIPDESRAARSIINQPRAVDCHGAGLQVVPETHSRPSWDPIHYVLLFTYGTNGFRRMARRRLWNTTAGDWCSKTAWNERRVVRASTDCSCSTLSTPVRKWNSSG